MLKVGGSMSVGGSGCGSSRFPDVDPRCRNEELGRKWETLIALRGEVSKAIEMARKQKVVGHSLDSCVSICAPEKLQALLTEYRDMMSALMIVSQVGLVNTDAISDPYESTEFEGLKIGVAKARGTKCERCWNYSETVGEVAGHPTICTRCAQNL